jgi:hypothetical protein
MQKKTTHHAANVASGNDSSPNFNSKTQRQKVLEWLLKNPLTTLEARQELFVMSIAARIFELKAQGHNIVTYKVMVGRKKIAQYVLLAKG